MAEGPSHALYRAPPNRFAAEFLGRANLLPVDLLQAAEPPGLARVRLGDATLLAMQPHDGVGARALLCVRPHDIALQPLAAAGMNTLAGTVRSLSWQGDLHSIDIDVHGTILRVVSTTLREPPLPGAQQKVYFLAEEATLIPYEDAA
jgi:2-aminoethylphosphonate transport system ATP-binding protein